MNQTNYHSKYFAYELTKRCSSDNAEKLAAAVAGAQVDLNPHQVDAALFAFSSPLSKGALLADEVGLGKTIEASLLRAFASSRENFLRENQHMMIDTRHFSRKFTQRLLESIEDLDELLDGVCFHSENFQALKIVEEKCRELLRCIYIDPPYNTDASPIM